MAELLHWLSMHLLTSLVKDGVHFLLDLTWVSTLVCMVAHDVYSMAHVVVVMVVSITLAALM